MADDWGKEHPSGVHQQNADSAPDIGATILLQVGKKWAKVIYDHEVVDAILPALDAGERFDESRLAAAANQSFSGKLSTKAAASTNTHPARNRQLVSTSSEIRRSEFMA